MSRDGDQRRTCSPAMRRGAKYDMVVMEPILVRVIRCLALAKAKTITQSAADAKAVNGAKVTNYVYQTDTRQ